MNVNIAEYRHNQSTHRRAMSMFDQEQITHSQLDIKAADVEQRIALDHGENIPADIGRCKGLVRKAGQEKTPVANRLCVEPRVLLSHRLPGVTSLHQEDASANAAHMRPEEILFAKQAQGSHASEPVHVPQNETMPTSGSVAANFHYLCDSHRAGVSHPFVASSSRWCLTPAVSAATAGSVDIDNRRYSNRPFSAAMCYSADNSAAYMTSIDSGLGRRHISSIYSNTSSIYSRLPKLVPSLGSSDNRFSPAMHAGISQRMLNRAAGRCSHDRNSRRLQSIAATGTANQNIRRSSDYSRILSDGTSPEQTMPKHRAGSFEEHSGSDIFMPNVKAVDVLDILRDKPESPAGDTQGIYLPRNMAAVPCLMRESSVVWMHGTDGEQQGQETFQNNESLSNMPTSQTPPRNSHANSSDCSYRMHNEQNNSQTINISRMQGVSTDIRQLETSKFMFYSSQTGVAAASSLIEPASGDMGIDDLIDNILGSDTGSEREGDACFWLDVAGASAQEISDIGDVFELHPLTVEDMDHENPRDKIDVFGDYVFIVYSSAFRNCRNSRHKCGAEQSSCSMPCCGSQDYLDQASWESKQNDKCNKNGNQICIVMRANYVLTFHCGHMRPVVLRVLERLQAMKHASALGQNRDSSTGYLANGGVVPPYTKEVPLSGLVNFPPYIVYAILDEITDQLSPEIVAIEQRVDAIDELVLILSHNEHENMLRQMGEQRRRILTTWQSTHPKIEVVETLVHMLSSRVWAMQSGLAEEVSQYLGDVHGHLTAAVGSCSRAEAVLSRSHSNYLAKISLELSRATFDSNSTTERWTMLGTIVVPINIVTSFLGVNLKVPGQDRDDTLNFFIVMACMVIYASATLAFWRWRQII